MRLCVFVSLVCVLSIAFTIVKAANPLPSDALRRRVLDILTDLSGQHTAQCTRNAQPLYKQQILDRYKVLYGHDTKDDKSKIPPDKLFALQSHKYFFAINLYNSFDILPDLISTTIKVASLLGIHNVYISIYENGSSDQTKAVLNLVEILSKAIGLRIKIRVSTRTRSAFYHRIEYLAEVRNEALSPLHHLRATTGEKFDTVVFMNDILPCVDDVLELIWQSRHNNAGITCAADYIFLDKVNSPVFYDNWVSRDMNGTALNNEPFHNVVVDEAGKSRFMEHLPFQVYSCWNGIAILDPAPLYQLHAVKFRMADVQNGECSASECGLICKDYWSSGYGRIMMVPRVKLSYDSKTYYLTHPPRRQMQDIRKYVQLGKDREGDADFQDRQWFNPHDRPFHPAESEMIDFKQPPEYVYCWGWDGAGFLSGPDAEPIWEETTISSKNPLLVWHDRRPITN